MSTPQAQKIGLVMLNDVRIAFAHGLFRMDTVQGQGRPAFSATALFPKTHPCMPLVQKAMLQVAEAKWPGKGQQTLQALAAGGKICLRDGNSKPDTAGYAGNLFISARTPTAPLVLDQNRQPLTQASGKPYSGCFVNMSLAIWAQDNQYGKRINAQLRGVQFVKDGEPLAGGGPASADEFGEVEATAAAANEFGSLFGGAAPAAQPNDFAALLGT
jgi:hypothetical protein